MFKRGILFLLLVIALAQDIPAFATPPARPSLPEAVTAYFVFPAGREPDSQRNFEIEVYCKANFPIDEIMVHLGHSEEIVFKPTEAIVLDEQTLRLFKGKMEQGEVKTWRLRGVVTKNAAFEGEEIPASLALYVDYLFPYKTVVRSIEEDTNLQPWEKEQMLTHFEREAGNTRRTIIKALPVQ